MAYVRRIAVALTTILAGPLACDPGEPEPTDSSAEHPPGEDPEDQPAECTIADTVRAGFSLDLGDWAAAGDDFEIDSACTVDAVGDTFAFTCDDAGQARTVKLTLAASHPLTPPLTPGASVTLSVRREAAAAADRGFWAVRDGDSNLVLAGARSYSSVPGSDPMFFAPLTLDVDFKTCPEQKTDTCKLEQRVILTVADGSGDTRVPQGTDAKLPSGLEMLVERAQLTMASGDAKTCPVDESTPETYQFLLARPAS